MAKNSPSALKYCPDVGLEKRAAKRKEFDFSSLFLRRVLHKSSVSTGRSAFLRTQARAVAEAVNS